MQHGKRVGPTTAARVRDGERLSMWVVSMSHQRVTPVLDAQNRDTAHDAVVLHSTTTMNTRTVARAGGR